MQLCINKGLKTGARERPRRTQRMVSRSLSLYTRLVCNLYGITSNQAAIVALTRAMRDVTGNIPSFPGVFPDDRAPIVRNAPDGIRELGLAGWGVPSSQAALMEAVKSARESWKPRAGRSILNSSCAWSPISARPLSATHHRISRWYLARRRVPATERTRGRSESRWQRAGQPQPRTAHQPAVGYV